MLDKQKTCAAAAALLVLALTGCGGGDAGAASVGSVSVVQGTSAETVTPTPTPTLSPTPTAVTSVAKVASAPIVTPTNPAGAGIVQAGDSIAAGHSTNGWNALDHLGFEAALVTTANVSVGGRLMATGYGLRDAELLPRCSDPKTCILIVQQGTNDLGSGVKARTLYHDYATPFVKAGQTAGYYVVLATILPRSDKAWSTSKEAERRSYNDMVRANSAGADVVGDFAASTILGDSTDTGATTYYADRLHLTSEGQIAMIDIYRTVLAPLLVLPRRPTP